MQLLIAKGAEVKADGQAALAMAMQTWHKVPDL